MEYKFTYGFNKVFILTFNMYVLHRYFLYLSLCLSLFPSLSPSLSPSPSLLWLSLPSLAIPLSLPLPPLSHSIASLYGLSRCTNVMMFYL